MALKNRLKIAGLALGLGLTGLGITGCSSSTNYSRDIEGVRVEYEENEGLLLSLFSSNSMDAVKGDTTFNFSSNWFPKKLDWKSNNASSLDSLSKIEISVGGKSKDYFAHNRKDSDLVGETTRAAFDRYHPWYNHLRNALRDSLRKDYLEGCLGVQNDSQR